jgi:putative salt-induced outer membrane protein
MCAAVTAAALLAASVPAQADWKGKGELGFVLSRGNSDAETLNAKLDMATEIDRWTHSLGFSALRATSANQTTANRYELHGQSNFKLTDRSFVFGALRYENDKFSAFTYQATASAGYGYKFIDSAATKLVGQVGVGYRQAEVRLTGEKENNAVFRGDLNFEHQLTETTKVTNKLLVESGSSNTFAEDQLALAVKMSDRLALSVGYDIRHNTNVPAGVKKTDQLTTANVVFNF